MTSPSPEQLRCALDVAARDDLPTFVRLSVRDEQSGHPVDLAPHHLDLLARWARHRRTVSWAWPEAGKSQLAAAYIAWAVCRDPSLRVGLLSGSVAQAQRLLRLVEIVLRSPGTRRIFPSTCRIERANADALYLASRPETAKDATVTAASYDLSSLLGSRLDVVVGDDLVSREAVRSPASRDRAYGDWSAIAGSRLAPGGTIHLVGTAEHSDDVLHRLSRLDGWHARSYPVIGADGLPAWPERWPMHRIEARRAELGPVGFARAMMCEPIDAASLIFDAEAVDLACRIGATPGLDPSGPRVVIGVDPAWTTGERADESGIVMVSIGDDGTRYVTHVEGRRLPFDSLAERVVYLARANRATVYVESNGAGGIIADIIGRQVACTPLPTTATSKRARVEALSAEMSSGRWVMHCPMGAPGPEMRRLCDEVVSFSFEAHCGDRMSALLLACEGARRFEARPKMRRLHLDLLRR